MAKKTETVVENKPSIDDFKQSLIELGLLLIDDIKTKRSVDNLKTLEALNTIYNSVK